MKGDYFVHDKGLCESTQIGPRTRVWAFAHILPGAIIGSDCNICDHVFIENDVVVGDRVTVKCGVQIWDGLRIGNDVFIGPNVTFTNDKYPRSKIYPEKFASTVIDNGASLGANCTILPGIKVGTKALIGAGAVVTQDVPPYAKVVGNPARIIGYVETENVELKTISRGEEFAGNSKVTGLREVTLHRDMRGSLNVGDFAALVPFEPKRFFIVSQVPSSKVRGEHAHKQCHQFLLCVAGSVSAIVDDGNSREMFVLDSPSKGLYMPPLTWGTQYNYSQDAVLLVFASDLYDPNDYIRSYDDFLRLVRETGK